jgi:UDP-N-acetylmuramoyl-tripeptide--D-alanyl-D-alanine ligase
VITEAAVDSRQAIPGGLFVALPGERLDGHDFVADAFQRGASFALIQHEIDAAYQTVNLKAGVEATFLPETDAPICLLVENTLSALQQIARFWRRKLDLDVVGITGSVGKSTTKEVVAEVLSQR